MTALRLLLQSIRYYWRTHVGVILGAALATLVLTGALMVGDSVKATLRAQAEARVGKIGEALLCGERFVPWARDVEKQPSVVARTFVPGREAAGVLMLSGTAARSDGSARANKVQMVGVDDAFWKLSPSGAPPSGAPSVPVASSTPRAAPIPSRTRAQESAASPTGAVAAGTDGVPPRVAASEGVSLNERLAAQLGVQPGDEVLLRLEKPSAFSKDAPLSGEDEGSVALRLRVAAVVGDSDFGRFALTAGQVPPFTAFIPLALLQEKLGVVGKVNVLIHPGDPSPQITDTPGASNDKALAADFDIGVRELPEGRGFEIRTPRVFIEDAVVAAARLSEKQPNPGQRENPPGLDSLTYFVNELRAGDGSDAKSKATPYSMVTAIDAPASGFIQAELADDEIQITRWLADDLGVGPGGKVTVKYFVMGERRQLVEKARTFTVLAPILEMDEPQLNSSWMPEFPGLADKENCRDWKPGFDFDATRMRDKDQDYWSKYRGTPKAFVNLRVGQEMWGNRWGKVTSIRYPAGTTREQVERVAAFIDPAALGFRTVNLREQALAATKAPVDFGELFVYFSFFLIAAAAVLTGLLFTFTIEQRAGEAGLLLAVGWPVKKAKWLFLREGFVLALIGSLVGALLAALYTKGVLLALAGVWSGATGGTQFVFAPSPVTMAIGVVSGVLVALFAMWFASRRLFKMEAAALLNGTALQEGVAQPGSGARESAGTHSGGGARSGSARVLIIAATCVAAALGLAIFARGNAGAFFGAGALLLIAGCLFALAAMRRAANDTGAESIAQLGVRNIARRRGRSLATIAVLASGVFMVIAVDSFRKGPLDDPTRRDSGTGGFAFIGESSAPIYEDLNSAKGREAYALDDKLMTGVHVVQFRVRDGDDASCLNLNRAVQPRILGVDFSELDQLGDVELRSPFSLVWHEVAAKEPGAVPGVVDANTLQWALQKKLGDVLEVPGDRGDKVPVEFSATVSGSILQGLVIVPERDFVAKFPNTAGYRFFLIDCPREKADAVREHLSRQLGDRGLELVPAAQRLAEFNAVENTYLSIFQVLGGLGVLLGSAGLGIVVARNVFERRREFGLLEAVGFTPRLLRRLVFAEHRWLIAGAVGIGAISALVAVWPRLAAQSSGLPWRGIAVLILGMTVLGAFWAWLATRLALRRSQLAALRTE